MGNVLALARTGLIFRETGRGKGYLGYSGFGFLVVSNLFAVLYILLLNIVVTIFYLIAVLSKLFLSQPLIFVFCASNPPLHLTAGGGGKEGAVQSVSVGTPFLNHKITVPSPLQPLTHKSTLQATPHCEDTADRDVRIASDTQRFPPHKATHTFLMNPRKTCVWSQELRGHIFVRTRNEDAFLGEETRKKGIRSAASPGTEVAEVELWPGSSCGIPEPKK